ncbi:MAG: histidine phosphatase family protein, partial [Proteobacteria bacterium]|nr:histidine phosphatase family protein [Pseudomonadota bacterium]
LVGHNPELEDLISHLVNETDLPDHKKLFPTAALARLMLPDDWSHLNKGCAQLLSITYSKSLLEETLEES